MRIITLIILAAAGALAQQSATVTIDTGKVIHKVSEKDFHGINIAALWNGSDPIVDDVSLQVYKQLGMGVLRFPGGVPCQWYDWKEPLATGWSTLTPESIGKFAKAGGSRMMFQTNTANDSSTDKDGKKYSFNSSGAHAAEWVLAMKKAGVDVAFWEIGNEPEMDAPKEFKDRGQDAIYEWYNKKYEEQVKAIKKADPKARVLGPAATNTWFWWAQGNLAKFMKAHGNKTGTGLADVISLHWYPEGGNGRWEDKRGLAQRDWVPAMEFIKKTIAEHDTRDLPLFITEWNWGAGDKNASGSEFRNAMGVADVIGMFLRTGVAGHNFFVYKRIKTNWGVVAMKDEDNRPANECSPTYYALALAGLLGGDVLDTATTSDEANVMSVYATRNAARVTSIMLINKTAEPVELKFEFKGNVRPTAPEIRYFSLVGESPSAKDVTFNGVNAPEPWKGALPPPKILKPADMASFKIAPYSVNVLQTK